MEKALFVSNYENLKYFHKYKVDRIYFGNEFCDKLLPTKDQLTNILNFCKKKRVNFSLVTPFCTDMALKKVNSLLKILPRNIEVIFNDFGLLELIKEKNLMPILGRLLVSVSRDPRIIPNSKYNSYFKSSNLQRAYINFLLTHGIFRIELDNVLQGYDIKNYKEMSLSLYYPFVCCSVTRKCIFANLGRLNTKFRVIESCNKECSKGSLKLYTHGYHKPIYIMGNAQYYINKDKSFLHKTIIDRLVYMPEFPNINI
jgi:hypothetical protein